MAELDPEKLLGGYAAGTLTEAERKALFAAALRDQTLFIALADEQALKELLDDPTSRRRLLEKLEQTERFETAETMEQKPEGWGALVPAWLHRPAARVEAMSPAAAPPSAGRRPTRWALAGSLVIAVLAVLISVQLYEEAELPPARVPTDTDRSTDLAPPAPDPSASAPRQPLPLLQESRASRANDHVGAGARSEEERRMTAGVTPTGRSARDLFYARAADPLLGVRYSLVKETGEGEAEVSPGTMFSAGEVLRLSFEVTRPCYLYVLKRSSSGSWALLFPGPGAAPDQGGLAAYVKEGTRYVVPPFGSLLETEARGPAQLFIVLARDPQPELADPPDAARVTDLVKRIRTEVAGGRLLVQPVDPSQPDIPDEQAVYVVDQGPVPAPRVLAEIMVSHR